MKQNIYCYIAIENVSDSDYTFQHNNISLVLFDIIPTQRLSFRCAFYLKI